ncbi:MAG: DUF1638 domain-containing protein [Rhodospirillaceae bacterium]
MTDDGTLPLILGCGIFRKEVAYLVRKNGWRIDTAFIDSGLHYSFHKLGRGLTGSLAKRTGREIIVFYGCCHPLMDRMVADAHAIRVQGQNCIDILLGRERFDRELAAGAYFLLEDWAVRWDEITGRVFGSRPEIIQEIFQGDRRTMLALRTPCSGDFTAAAERAATLVGLPLIWEDVGLDHLEETLRVAIESRREGGGD